MPDGDVAPAGRFVRAYVHASSLGASGADDASAGFIAALAMEGDVMALVRQRYAAWQGEVEADGLDPTLATLIRLAADGLWFADLLGLAPPVGASRNELIAAMLTLARPGRNERSGK